MRENIKKGIVIGLIALVLVPSLIGIMNYSNTVAISGEKKESTVAMISVKESPDGNLEVNVKVADPHAPQYLKAALDNNGNVQLTWDPPSDTSGIEYYNVYRSVDSDTNFVRIGGTQGTETYYTDENVEGGHTYYYEVRTVYEESSGSEQESDPSNEAQVTVPAVPEFSSYGILLPLIAIFAIVFWRIRK